MSPTSNFIKTTTEAWVIKEEKCIGIGVVTGNYIDEVTCAKSLFCKQNFSITVAELIAIKEGLYMAIEQKL